MISASVVEMDQSSYITLSLPLIFMDMIVL